MKNILVTGANGFLGSHLVRNLLEHNFSVTALVRSKKKLENIPWQQDVNIIEADLCTHKNLSSVFIGIDALVHLAACKQGDEETQFESTVVGTERLLEAMGHSETKRLILISSLTVYGYDQFGKVLNEEIPLETNLYRRDGYTIAKVWQERITRKISQKNGWGLTVLRPAFIWGNDQEYPLVLSLPFKKLHLIVGPMKTPHMVHVQRCAQAITRSLEDDNSIGQTFNIIDEENVNSWKFMKKYLKKTEDRAFRVPIPYGLGYAFICSVYKLSRILLKENLKIPSIFFPSRFQARFKPFISDDHKIVELLDWRAQVDIESLMHKLHSSKIQNGAGVIKK